MRLAKTAKLDPQATSAVMAWFRVARRANGTTFEEIRESFPGADRVGNVVIL